MWSDPRTRAAADLGEADQEGAREETVVGNACGGEPAATEEAVLLSHAEGRSHHHSGPLLTGGY